MKLLSSGQIEFLTKRKLNYESINVFPRFGFYFYNRDKTESTYMNTNPFTKSLDGEFYVIKEKLNNGLIRVNFYKKPVETDGYLDIEEAQTLTRMEIAIFYIFCSPFMVLWNVITLKYWRK